MPEPKLTIIIDAENRATIKFNDVEQSAEKVGASVGRIDSKLRALSALPGPLGAGLSQAAQAAGQLEGAISAAGLAAGGLLAALAAVAAGGVISVQKAMEWNNVVDSMVNATGASAEFSSTFLYGAKIAGANAQQLTHLLSGVTKRLDDTGEAGAQAMAKLDRAAARAGERLQEMAEDHAEATADALEALAEAEADKRADNLEATRQYYERIGDMAEAHGQRLKGIDQSIADARAAFDEAQQRRNKQLAAELAELEERAGGERAKVQAQFANANTEAGKKALAAELAALDERTRKEKDKLQAKARDEETEDVRSRDKQIERLQEQLRLENTEYAKQTGRIHDEYARRLGDLDVSLDKAHTRTEKALARQEKQYQRSVKALNDALADASAAMIEQAFNPLERGLEDLGINVEEFNKLEADEKVLALLDAFMEMPKGTERSGAAFKLFNQDAEPFLAVIDLMKTKGSDARSAIEKLTEEAIANKHHVTGDMLEANQQATWSFNEMRAAIDGVAIGIGQNLIPKVVELTKTTWYQDLLAGRFGQAVEKLKQSFADWVASILANPLGLSQQQLAHWIGAPFGGLFEQRAEGGPVLPGMAYLVGEHGPELFLPRMGGQIINSSATSSITHNYNYAPTYGSAPASPSADFAMMRAVAGVGS